MAPVTRRLTWLDTEPFPGNPIFPKRIEAMHRGGPSYRPELVGSPIVADTSHPAFPGYSDDTIFLLEGNHRRVLAEETKNLDTEILVQLHRGLTAAEMHRIRRGLNDKRTVKPSEVFLHRAAENPKGVEADIQKLVEGLGWHISYDRENYGLPCTNELTWIKSQGRDGKVSGDTLLTRTLCSYEAVWGQKLDPKTMRAQARVIKGLGAFWKRYPQADLDRLADALRDLTVDEVYDSGRATNDTIIFIRTVHDGIRYSMAMAYNRLARKGRLDP